MKPAWVISFDNLCEPDFNCLQLLNDTKTLKEMFDKESKLTNEHIYKILNQPVCNIDKLFTQINKSHYDIPVGITDDDIYLYFCKYIFGEGNHIWNSFFSPPNNPPERIIYAAITRLDLDKHKPKPELGVLRYCLIYGIFKFHYTNIYFMIEYIDVLRKSIIFSTQINNNKLMRNYVLTLYEYATNLMKEHIKISENDKSKLNYSTIYQETVNIYKCISVLEKLTFYIMSGSDFCKYHILASLFKFDKNAFSKYFEYNNLNSCTCHKMQIKLNLSGNFISQLGKATTTIKTTLDNMQTCHAMINVNSS